MDNQAEKVSDLQSKIGQLQQEAYDKNQVIYYMIIEHFQEPEGKYSHKDQIIDSMIKDPFKELEGKDARIREISQLHANQLASKDIELRDMANKMMTDRKKSNIVSVCISCCLYNVGTCY